VRNTGQRWSSELKPDRLCTCKWPVLHTLSYGLGFGEQRVSDPAGPDDHIRHRASVEADESCGNRALMHRARVLR
jgi:hypothetical protein